MKILDKDGLEVLASLLMGRFARKEELPTRLSQLENDCGYLQAEQGARVLLDTGGHDPFLVPGEQVTVAAALWNGTERVSSGVSWTVTRDSGDSASDTAWNASDKAAAASSTGSLAVAWDDLGASPGTVFTFSASADGLAASASLTI